MNANSLLVGGLLGIAATLGGLGLAKADCHLDYPENTVAYGLSEEAYEEAFAAAEERADLHDAHELNVWRAEAICDQAVQHWIEDDQLTEEQIDGAHGWDGMWEACMRLATPVTVLPAAQHYDTQDGAFWTVGQ